MTALPRSFHYFLWTRFAGNGANNMLLVALGWQMYDFTGSAWNLALVGLYQFLPAIVLSFGTTALFCTPTYALTIADLNRDGHRDLLVGFVEAPSAAFFGDGKKGFTRVTFGDSRGAVYGFAVADLDGDGNLDIAAARSEAPNMVYFAGKDPRG